MARIAGVDIPNQKRIEIALTYIYGIGKTSAKDILAKTGINPDTRSKDLTDEEVANIIKVLYASHLRYIAGKNLAAGKSNVKFTEEEIDTQLTVNFKASFQAIQEYEPYM